MARFVQIGHSYWNADTVARVDDEPGIGFCTLVFVNGERLRVRNSASQAVAALSGAVEGMPQLFQADGDPQIH